MANFENIKELTLKKEGGLARTTTDTASQNASPCVHNGLTGWHTNKGVQWIVFKDFSKKFGYEASCDNFINMPYNIWYKIAKNGYWDELNLDNLKNDGVAFQLFSWHWGRGYGFYTRLKNYLSSKGVSWDGKSSTMANAINQLIDKQGEKQTIDDLTEVQKKDYTAISQPANIRGWINRIEDTTKYAYTFIGKKVSQIYSDNKKKINYTIIGVGLIALSFFAWKQYKKLNK